MKHLSAAWKADKLWGAVLISWYLTVISVFGDTYLLQFSLPIGGHFYLFRGILPLTVLLFAVWCIKRKHNPFFGLAALEKAFLLVVVVMGLYGTVSVFFAISKGAWFAKYLTMGMYFCFTLLFVLLGKDSVVRRTTVLLSCGSILVCTLGGLIETVTVHNFFDTPYGNNPCYYFMGKCLQPPIFTFYNTNGFTVMNFFGLLIAWMALFDCWPNLSRTQRRCSLWGLTAVNCVSIFLYFSANGRLTIWALPFLLMGLAVWLFLRYKRGLWIFAAFTCCFMLIYAGEHYEQIKADITYVIESIEASKTPSETPDETPGAPVNSESTKPTRPVVQPNNHGTINTLVPVSTETGKVSISADESGGIRMNLLKNSLQMLIGSKGLGIGLGNAEQRMAAYGNTDGILAVHCFIMEIFLEFGIFAILPLLLLVCALLWVWYQRLRRAFQERDRVLLSNTLFQVFAILTYPFLSTANSSSWGIGAMWLFLGYILVDNAETQNTIKEQLYTSVEG